VPRQGRHPRKGARRDYVPHRRVTPSPELHPRSSSPRRIRRRRCTLSRTGMGAPTARSNCSVAKCSALSSARASCSNNSRRNMRPADGRERGLLMWLPLAHPSRCTRDDGRMDGARGLHASSIRRDQALGPDHAPATGVVASSISRCAGDVLVYVLSLLQPPKLRARARGPSPAPRHSHCDLPSAGAPDGEAIGGARLPSGDSRRSLGPRGRGPLRCCPSCLRSDTGDSPRRGRQRGTRSTARAQRTYDSRSPRCARQQWRLRGSEPDVQCWSLP